MKNELEPNSDFSSKEIQKVKNSLGEKESVGDDYHFSGLDPDSIQILASIVAPKSDRLGSIDNWIRGIDENLSSTFSTGSWFEQQIKLRQELIRLRPRISDAKKTD